jgi:DNA-binding transcriptional MerR regulator
MGDPPPPHAGYRLYGPAELQRLRTLRELLERHEVGLSDVAFALRLRRDALLAGEVEGWLAAEAERPDDVPAGQWLAFEQDKHSKLVAAAMATPRPSTTTSLETA